MITVIYTLPSRFSYQLDLVCTYPGTGYSWGIREDQGITLQWKDLIISFSVLNLLGYDCISGNKIKMETFLDDSEEVYRDGDFIFAPSFCFQLHADPGNLGLMSGIILPVSEYDNISLIPVESAGH